MPYTIPSYTVRPGAVYQPKPISQVDVPVYIKQNARGLYAAGLGTTFNSTKLLDQSPLHLGTRRAGQQGRCYTADGTDDEVNYGDIGTAIWFSGWVRLNSDNQCLFSLSNDTNTNVIVSAGVLTVGATLTLTGIKVDDVSKTASEAGVLLNDNEWHFLSCGIGDGLGGGSTADDVRFFTDGTNHGSVSGFDWRFYSTTPTANELTEAYSGTGARNIAAMSKYALWDKMDTQSGATSYDSSGNELTGVLTNITAANFHTTQDVYSFQNQVGYNRRMYFDGVNDYVEIDSILTDFSSKNYGKIEINFCAESLSNKTLWFASNDVSDSYFFGVGISSNASIFIMLRDTGKGNVRHASPGGVVDIGRKYIFCVTLNSSGEWIFELNGSVITFTEIYGGPLPNMWFGNLSAFFIKFNVGRKPYTGGIHYFNGSIYDFKIYDEDLTSVILNIQGYGNADADWVDEIGSNDGAVEGSPSNIYTPRDESDLANDVLGNPLTYTGTRPNDASLINSSCLTADGTLYIAAAHLAGTETVVRSGGTSTPSISAGRIDFTAGTCWDLLLSDGTYYPLADCWGTPISNAAVDGDDGVLTDATLASAWGATQDEFHYNILNGFSLYEHASTAAIRVPFVNGSARSFTPPTGYTLTAHYPAGNYRIPAEAEINFNPDSTPEMGGQLGSYTAPVSHAFGDDMDPGATDQGFVRQTSSKEDRFAIFAEPQTGAALTTIERWTT